MHGGDDGEEKGRPQEGGAGDPDPANRLDQKQQRKEDGGDLGKRVGLAEHAGAKIAQAGDHEEHAADEQNGDVAAEHDHRVFPRNLMLDGKHEKHGAHEQLVGDGIEVLAEQRLLMQSAGQQSVESVAKPGEDKQCERPLEVVLHQIDDDERQKDHAQQRELVGRGQHLAEIHRAGSPAAGSENSPTRMGTGSWPVFSAKRCARDWMLPSGRSSSMRSMRCIGKNTTPEVNGSPALIWATRSSNEARSTPRRLRPMEERVRIAPQNFSRGLPSVTMTSAPAWKGLGTSGF